MNGKSVFISSLSSTSSSSSNKMYKSTFNSAPTISVTITQSEDSIYKALSDFAVTLDVLLKEYSDGNFQKVAIILTRDKYNSLSVQLNKLQKPQNKTYENLRLMIQASMQGLYKAIQQYSLLINTQYELITQTNKANVLNSIESIKQYIKSIKKTIQIFPNAEITAISAKIRPEYAQYIKLYGYPQSGVFDMTLLAAIITSLNIIV